MKHSEDGYSKIILADKGFIEWVVAQVIVNPAPAFTYYVSPPHFGFHLRDAAEAWIKECDPGVTVEDLEAILRTQPWCQFMYCPWELDRPHLLKVNLDYISLVGWDVPSRVTELGHAKRAYRKEPIGPKRKPAYRRVQLSSFWRWATNHYRKPTV